jgi:predicted dehydrogenase
MTLNWGILGTGRITRKLAAAIHAASGAELVGVASRDTGRAESAAAELGAPRAYGSYAALLADPGIDAVYNALPNSLHAEWTIRAAEAGKHILCEKPMASSPDEAQAMAAAAQQHGVRLMEAFMYRFHPQTMAIQELVASGAVGSVQAVRADFGFLLDRPSDIRWQAGLDGGALKDVGSYCLNFCRMLLGTRPVRVSAAARWADTGVDALLSATLEYASGQIAQISCDFVSSFHQTAQVFGQNGLIEVDRAFTMPPDRAASIRVTRGVHFASPETISFPACNHYQLQIEGFGKLIIGGAALPEMPLAETLDNHATIAALYQSAREGKPVDVV